MSRSNRSSAHQWQALAMWGIALFIAVATAGYQLYRQHQEPRWVMDEHGDGQWTRYPCEKDEARFCADVPRGEGRVTACLREHPQDLSAPCQQFLEQIDPSDNWRGVCGQDLVTHCAGRSRPISCLKDQQASLSPRCRALVVSFEATARWRHACSADASRLCPESPVTEAGAGACLTAHSDELSPSCQAFYGSHLIH